MKSDDRNLLSLTGINLDFCFKKHKTPKTLVRDDCFHKKKRRGGQSRGRGGRAEAVVTKLGVWYWRKRKKKQSTAGLNQQNIPNQETVTLTTEPNPPALARLSLNAPVHTRASHCSPAPSSLLTSLQIVPWPFRLCTVSAVSIIIASRWLAIRIRILNTIRLGNHGTVESCAAVVSQLASIERAIAQSGQ